MSELPPDVAVEPEPTDSDPPPDAIRSDRPRIWPTEPRPPRPQIKRPMEEWLDEFEQRVKAQPASGREMITRRRRPRGLARIVPVVEPPRVERGRPAAQPGQPGEPRGRRRRRRGSGRGAAPGSASGQAPEPQTLPPRQPQAQLRTRRRRRGRGPSSPPNSAANQGPGQGQAVRPPSAEGIEGQQRRRRRRGRGRGRGQGGPGNRPAEGGSSGPSVTS